ncbi:MAG: beta-lactamase family protein [Epsilonproteobacteria bacterium]|nr:beta-lactamase family protein [Campylobacterota bacterium]
MKKISILILTITLLSVKLSANIADFEQFVSKEIEDKTPPSASFAILKGSKVVYTKSMGYNDANMTQETNTSSVYHVFSLTKILTAVVVMQLVEEGKLSLDTSVKKFFPYLNLKYDGKFVDITILNLLNHSSGIGDRSDEVREMLFADNNDSFVELPYLPGSEAKYSSAEYIILGKIIEMVTDKEFGEVVKERILNPVGMSRSDFTYNETIADNQVYGTIPFFSLIGTVMRFMIDDSSKDFYEGCTLWLKSFDIKWKPAGGLISSIDDMAKFLSAYNSNQLFSTKTKALFDSNETVPVHSWLSSQDEVSFGIGWYHIRDKGRFFYQHQGVGPGFRTIMRIYPKLDTSIIILTSQTSIDIDDWADRLIEEIVDEKNIDNK